MATACAGAKKVETKPSAPIESAICDAVAEHEARRDQGAKEIARDHHPLDGPAVDEHSRERRDERSRRGVGNRHQYDVRRRSVQAEGDGGDDAEEREEVAKDRNELRQPDFAEDRLSEERRAHTDIYHVYCTLRGRDE